MGVRTLFGLAAGAALLDPQSSHAQDTPPPTLVQELIVTGSRLPQRDETANSPITTVSEEDLQKSGALTLDIVLNRLPQVVPSYSSASNNPSAQGASYVDLRGLGESRNLVLLDGRRMVGANASNAVDLNTIPSALIERVEIVTGGASAVYGADAVAGVVNVILKDRFDGFEAGGRTLVSDRGDGREHEVTLTAGRRFARGDLTASFGWVRREEIGKGERDFSSQAANPSGWIPSGSYFAPLVNAPSQQAIDALFAAYGVPAGTVAPFGGVAGFGFNADGTLFATGVRGGPLDVRNYRGPLDEVVTGLFPDVYAYNFEPFNKLILPLERRSGAVFGALELDERTTVFAQAMGTRYTAATALAPTPAPTQPNPLYPGRGVVAFTIPVTNPFIGPDLAQLLASRTGDIPALAGAGATEEFLYRFRTVALGPRESSNRATSAHLLGGVRTELAAEWRAEAYASFGRYTRTETQDGLLSVLRFEQLLDSPTGGTEFCPGGFNPFGAGIGEACRDFLRVRARYRTEVEQENVVATASGPLFRLPAGAVMAVAGAEHRHVDFSFRPPSNLTPDEVAGFIPLSAVEGSVRFLDLFAEASVPLLADRPFARSLEVVLGYRRSEERTSGGVDSYKAEVGWTPIEALRFRGSAQRAVRAPDIFERYEPPVGSGALADDPCAAGPARTAQVLDLCRRQAVALGFAPSAIDNFRQFTADVAVVLSGTPDLEPERATTFTVGAVWTTRWRSDWLGDLHGSVDWYSIKVKGAIGYLDPQLVFNGCYNIGGETNPTYDPANPFCTRIARSSVNFEPTLDSPRTNQARLETAGIDVTLGFRTDLGALAGRPWLGRLDTRATASWLDRFEEQDSTARPKIDYAGTIAGALIGYQSLPRWKGRLDLGWSSGDFGADLSGRYIGKMEHRLRRIDPDDAPSGVGDAWYWDLAARWALDRRAELRAGVLNLFDRRPEIYRDAVDANTDPSTYDVVGRRFWVALTLRL